MRVAGTLSVVVTLALSSACLAGSQNISAQLRDQAVQNCTGDAMRLCLASILDEEQTTQCMKTPRPAAVVYGNIIVVGPPVPAPGRSHRDVPGAESDRNPLFGTVASGARGCGLFAQREGKRCRFASPGSYRYYPLR